MNVLDVRKKLVYACNLLTFIRPCLCYDIIIVLNKNVGNIIFMSYITVL